MFTLSHHSYHWRKSGRNLIHGGVKLTSFLPMASSVYLPIAPSVGIKNQLCNQELALWLQIASESSDDGDITHRPHGSKHLLPRQSPYIAASTWLTSHPYLQVVRPFLTFAPSLSFPTSSPLPLLTFPHPFPYNEPLSRGTVLAWCGLSGYKPAVCGECD